MKINKTIRNIYSGKINLSRGNYFSSSKQQKYYIRQLLSKKIDELLSLAEKYSLGVDNTQLMTFYNIDNISERNKEIMLKFLPHKPVSSIINNITKAKDEILLSDSNYERFRKSVPVLPSIHYIRKSRHVINASLFKTFRNRYGSYNDCEHKITYIIEKNIEKLEIKNNIIRVKLCGDGTNCGTRHKLLNFCFTLPDQGKTSKTSMGNYTLGVFRIKKEDYKTLKESLLECSASLKKLSSKQILIGGQLYQIKFLISGDMKFLHIIMGLNSCNSKNSCLYCKINKNSFSENNKILINSELRTIDDLRKNIENSDPGVSINGYLDEPIFDFISFEDVVFDTLHLLLRITGKLLHLLLYKIKSLDKDENDYTHQLKFYAYLEMIGIKNPKKYERIETENTSKMVLTMRSLNGQDCLIALKKMDLDTVFKQVSEKNLSKKIISDTFREFYEIYNKIKEKFYIENTLLLEDDTSNWLELFNECFPSKHVTPYMHLFASHICFFVESYGDVDLFNMQGLEKLNDFTTSQFYRATNKNKYYVGQILAQRNRLEDYRHLGTELNLNKKVHFSVKAIRKTIIEDENQKSWCQFKIKEQVISNSDIRDFEQEKFSITVVEASLYLLKSENTHILPNTLVYKIFTGDNQALSDINLSKYRFLSGLFIESEHVFLLFIDILDQNFYLADPYIKNKDVKNGFFKKWLEVCKKNSILKTEAFNWRNVELNFRMTDQKFDINSAIVLCFFSLSKNKTSFKISKKQIEYFKSKIFNLLNQYCDLSSFCSYCSLDNDLENAYECQCKRKYHKYCLDERYIKLYKYSNFECYFCRNNYMF